ncbi:MAG TPA: hypothetical protein VEO54_01190 [Thermoanaerobaculia bacterium]|nr:hypothetical protein [Thermoanaerobaculia bacterium]
MHDELRVVGVQTALPVKLQEVYVALRGDRIGAQELLESQQLLEEQLRELNELFDGLPEAEQRRLRAEMLRDHPHMLSLRERDRAGRGGADLFQGRAVSSMTLADAFSRERWLVILGDPGSGKTTLARWLALGLARAMRMREARMLVPAAHVNPETPYDLRMIDLGAARLPILVHVSELAEALARAKREGKTLTMVEWLPRATWKRQPPSDAGPIPEEALKRLFLDALDPKHGGAVVILDGLDEIPEKSDRLNVIEAVCELCRDFIPDVNGSPLESGGSQLIVTSRIAGYHSAPLAMRGVATVTIEPMRRVAVEHFCETWMRAVHRELRGATTPEVDAEAQEKAEALIVAIFSRASLTEIATNPLLIASVASLFLAQPELPNSRAGIYQALVEMLVGGWRETGLDPDEVVRILEPVAAEIHASQATGLIEAAHLKRLITDHLVRARGGEVGSTIREEVRRFITVLSEQVGLIAGRGERLYGFLHLTFQEYMAGRHLVADPATAAAAILAKLGDPRWREPILLAIGHIGLNWPIAEVERLLDELLALDDPLGAFLPRVALLLGEAVAELPELPERLYRRLIRRLLGAYAATSTRELPLLERRIERALLRLRRFGDTVAMDEVLAEAIATPDAPDLAPAAAAVAQRNGWLSDTVVHAMRDGLEHDSAAWQWPIEQALADLASPPPPEVIPVVEPVDQLVRVALTNLEELETGELLKKLTAAVPRLRAQGEAEEAELNALRETPPEDAEGKARLQQLEEHQKACAELAAMLVDVQAGGAATREMLTRAVDEARAKVDELLYTKPRDYERRLARYALAAAAREDFDLRNRMHIRPETGFELSMRDAVERRLNALNVRQLGALAAVYGGYPDRRGAQTAAEYHELALFLQRSDSERETRLDATAERYVMRFGNSDVIYRIARYLDEKMEGRLDLAKEDTVFLPEAMYRSSPLDRVMLLCLRASQAEEWIQPLRDAWRHGSTLRAKADAIAALVAFGEDVVPELRDALAHDLTRAAAEAAIQNLRRLTVFLRDPVYRSANVVLADLAALQEPEPWHWIDLIDPVLLELARSTTAPINFSVLIPAAPYIYRPVLQADRWCRMFSAGDDRAAYAKRLLVDVPPVDELVPLLANVAGSPSLRAGRLLFRWPVEPIGPKLVDDPLDIPIEALEALEALHLELVHPDLLYVAEQLAIEQFSARAANDPELWVALNAFAIRLGMVRDPARVFPSLVASADPSARLLHDLDFMRNHYLRVRAMADLLPLLPRQYRQKLFSECVRAVGKVRDAFRRSRLFEVLLPLAGEAERERVVAEADAAARKVRDAEQRARSLARLARWREGTVVHVQWADAVRSAAAIEDPDRKAETLRLLGAYMPAHDGVRTLWFQATAGLPSEETRVRAHDRRASLLLRRPPASLCSALTEHAQTWTPVLFVAAVQETLAQLEPARIARDLWLSLAADPANCETVRRLLALEAEDGIALTAEAARAVEALSAAAKTESLRLLLPLLQAPTVEGRRHVGRWLSTSDPFLADHAGLLIAENGRRINHETLPHLLALLERGPERSRCRVELVLRSSIWSVEKEGPCLNVSELGVGVCDALARVASDPSVDVRVARVCDGITVDYVHDSPEALQSWIGRLRNDPQDAEARQNLRMVLRLTPGTWPRFLEWLIVEDVPVQLVLLEALAQMVYLKGRVPEAMQPQVVAALRRLRPEKFRGVTVLAEPERAVAAVSIEVASSGAIAEECLERHTTTLEVVLRTEGDEKLLAALRPLGRMKFRMLDGTEPEAQAAAAEILAHESAFQPLVEWLTVRLARDPQPLPWFDVTSALMTVTARAVRLRQATYGRHADRRRLEPLLVRAARHRLHANGRRAAIVLLGHLPRVSRETVDAFLFALGDDRDIQDAAVDVIARLPLRSDMIQALVRTLDSENPGVVRGAARMLAVIASDDRTSRTARDEILQALVQGVERSRLRGIYQLAGTGTNATEHVNLTRLGTLDQELYRAILHLTGLTEAAQ